MRLPLSLVRFAAELRRAPREAEVDAALASLAAVKDGDGVGIVIAPGEGRALARLGDDEADVVRLAPGTYAAIPTREGRVRLLRQLRDVARRTLRVHVTISLENSHSGRAMVDGPRLVLRRIGVPIAEPGDRFGPSSYAHCFFDEEALLGEFEAAGLALQARRGFTFDLAQIDEAAPPAREEADPFATEVTRAARLVRAVDRARVGDSPEGALAAMRLRGVASGRGRGPIGRARLRRAIGWVDAPFGASCYRRVLLESALDAGAATETVVFGLDVGKTGHVAFEGLEDRSFDVAFSIPA